MSVAGIPERGRLERGWFERGWFERGWWLALALVLGCGEPAPLTTELTLRVPDALECRPERLDRLTVRALGDFPTRDGLFEPIDLEGGLESLDRFPPETELVSVVAEGSDGWRGGALVRLGEPRRLDVLLAPFGRSCPIGDPRSRAAPGSATLALADARALVVGGVDERGSALREVLLLEPRQRLPGTLIEELFLPRTSATATLLADGRHVLVAGGAPAAEGSAHDTAEVHDPDIQLGGGPATLRLREARREHAAALLPDGRVLIVGGRSSTDGPPLRSAELFDAETGVSTSTGDLGVARVRPSLRVLDDGAILVIGGEGQAGEPVTEVERFDPAQGTFERVGRSEPRAGGRALALPGGRVLLLGGRDASGARRADASLLLEGGSREIELPLMDPALVDLEGLALGDGRALIVGRDAGGNARARIFEPVSGRLESLDASRAPRGLLGLDDGTIVELDAEGLSLRRLDLANVFDDPPSALFPGLAEDRDRLTLDAPGHWSPDGSGLEATREGAWLSLAGTRFAAVAVRLDLSGEARLSLVTPEGPLEVELGEHLGFGGCVLDNRASVVEIVLSAEALTLRTEGRTLECERPPTGRARIDLRASEGARLRSIAIARL